MDLGSGGGGVGAGGVGGAGVDDEKFIDERYGVHQVMTDASDDGADGVRLIEGGDADGDALALFERRQGTDVLELAVMVARHGGGRWE